MLVGCSSGNAVGRSANFAFTSSGHGIGATSGSSQNTRSSCVPISSAPVRSAAREQLLEAIGRGPVVGVLEHVGVVVGLLDDLLDEAVGADVAVGVQQRDARVALDEAGRRVVRGVVDHDDAVERARLLGQRLERVVEPLLALEMRDQGEHARVLAEALALSGLRERVVRHPIPG